MVSTLSRRTRVQTPAVLQVVISLSPGGTERLVADTVRQLSPTYPMAVVCLDEAGAWGEALRQEGIEVVALRRRQGFSPLIGKQIADLADRYGADVLHCHHYSPFVYGCLARAFRPRLRVIYTEHGRFNDAPPSRKRRLANAVFSRLPDRVCVVSADLKGHMVAEGFRASAIRIVANGIDPGPLLDAEARQRIRAQLQLDPSAVVVGTVGRLDPVKDLPTLIRAFAAFRLTTPAARLVMVGDGPMREELERAADGIAGIHFTGHRADARHVMAAFDAYVSSSVFEGMSLTILEAMAAGLPVVATRVGGSPEIVVDGETGLLVPPGEPDVLAHALTELTADRARARAMGLAGRRRVCERFTLRTMINHYASAYSELGAS
jgi:L-malate glycosyltransferase